MVTSCNGRRRDGCSRGSKFNKINGRHEETRTPDLYRVNPARIGFSTTCKCVETAQVHASRTRHRFLWVGLWVENLRTPCAHERQLQVMRPPKTQSWSSPDARSHTLSPVYTSPEDRKCEHATSEDILGLAIARRDRTVGNFFGGTSN